MSGQVIVYPGEDGFWVAESQVFQDAFLGGREQAIANIREAIEGYILALQDDKLPVPRGALSRARGSRMSRLPQVSGPDVVRALQKVGFSVRRRAAATLSCVVTRLSPKQLCRTISK